jgi:hypothetical protein
MCAYSNYVYFHSEIFGMGITTIMHCFIADEEMFAPDKRFADGALRTTWQKTVQAHTSDGKVRTIQVAPVCLVFVLIKIVVGSARSRS